MWAGLLSTERVIVRDVGALPHGLRQYPTRRYSEAGRNPAVSRNLCTYALLRDLGGFHVIPLSWRERLGKEESVADDERRLKVR